MGLGARTGRGLPVALAFLAAALAAPGRAPARTTEVLRLPEQPEFVPGELLVKFRPGAPEAGDPVFRAMGVEPLGELTSGGEVLYRIPDVAPALSALARAQDRTLAAVAQMAARPDVEYSQPNYLLRPLATTPDDPRYAEQWHYRDHGPQAGGSLGGIDLPAAWDRGTGDRRVVVAVLDTGILPDHPDVAGSANLLPGWDMISSPEIAGDGGGRDPDPSDPGDGVAAGECYAGSPAQPDSWHGTHVAGTVGVGGSDNGVGVAGVNWQVGVQPLRVLGRCGGTTADIADAIRWAAGLAVPGVPPNPTPARVLNLSLGGRGACSLSPVTQAAIDDAIAAGAAVVVAAGNEASDAGGFQPASCRGAIAVAASDARGQLATRYSNFGEAVAVMAPGGDRSRDDDGDGAPDGVLSLVRGGYELYNGTSMAAPHVAGVAALWLAQDPGLETGDLLAELRASARPRSAAQCPRPCGAGLLSALRAESAPPPPPPGEKPPLCSAGGTAAGVLGVGLVGLLRRRSRAG
jgi:serine protease